MTYYGLRNGEASPRTPLLLCLALVSLCCGPIRNRPISFSEWRVQETIKYVNNRYDRQVTSLAMLPVMVVSHFTAMDSLEVSFNYMNKEMMEEGRSVLKQAGANNIAVHFLVGKAGEIYRLMPEDHIGRHVIGLNRHAIGIENVGLNEKSLTRAQVEANAYIVRHVAKKFPLHYLIGHSEYRRFEKTPLWDEKDDKYRTEKDDPGESFMQPLRVQVADLGLKAEYDGGELPARIGYLLDGYHKRGEFTGNAVVVRGGVTIFARSFGEQSTEVPIYTASAAKSLTAAAIALLESRRKLSYDSPATTWFPAMKALLQGVRVKHLLSHTSGLDDYYKLGEVKPGFTNNDALAVIATQKKLLTAPGKKFHYANSNYILLAEIIARVSGKSFPDFMRAEIFAPAGIAGVFALETDRAPLAAIDAAGKPFEYQFKTCGAGGLYLTAAGLAQFDLTLLAGSLLPAAKVRRLMQADAHVDAKEVDYGMGWYVYKDRGVVYHDGNFGAYHSMNWLQPKEKNAIILLAARDTGKIKEITYELDRILNGLQATKLK